MNTFSAPINQILSTFCFSFQYIYNRIFFYVFAKKKKNYNWNILHTFHVKVCKRSQVICPLSRGLLPQYKFSKEMLPGILTVTVTKNRQQQSKANKLYIKVHTYIYVNSIYPPNGTQRHFTLHWLKVCF